MMNKNVNIESLLQFVYKPFEQYSLDDLLALVEHLENYVAFSDSSSKSASSQQIAEVGLNLLTEEIRIMQEKKTAGR